MRNWLLVRHNYPLPRAYYHPFSMMVILNHPLLAIRASGKATQIKQSVKWQRTAGKKIVENKLLTGLMVERAASHT
ncbi:hypothetical protein [Dictyobacter alpinus]|uniref:hypothetical protein n=1 Tax=Dictyobacter alpinus TaxID=2014873 RepID=UPI000F827F21|nr:hypothetical protein [Dictyobacter alpinus]